MAVFRSYKTRTNRVKCKTYHDMSCCNGEPEGTVSLDDEKSCVDEVPVLRRSARKRNPPTRRTSSDFV
ncbi:hypothetical protein DPMN_083751 [Dreissena polymorpha]|uniref:Uncharacterized protein n=1 Tax=Dreissena polymorpha TaxID=45954 RepID=A0A9D3YBW6_DREPO|nr:hypothetical protein DPMN_083751 [Dreissena polymorpha]